MITMQRDSPFLVGMCEFPINSSEGQKEGFARKVWESLAMVSKSNSSIIDDLCGVLNYPRWKRTVRYLIRDGYNHFYGVNPSNEEIEKYAMVWDERNR